MRLLLAALRENNINPNKTQRYRIPIEDVLYVFIHIYMYIYMHNFPSTEPMSVCRSKRVCVLNCEVIRHFPFGKIPLIHLGVGTFILGQEDQIIRQASL